MGQVLLNLRVIIYAIHWSYQFLTIDGFDHLEVLGPTFV